MANIGQNERHAHSSRVLIVGIGAGAGGTEALQAFFSQVPADLGAAYIVMLHVPPGQEEQLPALLEGPGTLPVRQVTDSADLVPGHIYLFPADRHFEITGDRIRASRELSLEEQRAPIDILFRTLAEARHVGAVAVVLSGAGAHGSMGLKQIKEKGGAAFVQHPGEALFQEMPRNAIATHMADDVLHAARIPGHILAYSQSFFEKNPASMTEAYGARSRQVLQEIFSQLQLRTGHDFSNYKEATVIRRLERRMAKHHLGSLAEYALFSAAHPDETQALLKDLLISVTNFFRDRTPFTYWAAEVLPALFAGKGADDQLRFWVAGCATGEEVYSLAMLCAEYMAERPGAPRLQLFATDIDEMAIMAAREGYYTINDAADVSAERLARFFTREGDGYRIRREIREMVVFACHNFLKDPPFSRIDFISCRNVLIYLNRAAQERVMETFYFALKPGGYLMLGTSESADTAGDFFKPLSREQHIYQRRLASAKRSVLLPGSIAAPGPAWQPGVRKSSLAVTPALSSAAVHLQLLEAYAPPSLLLNTEFELVHISPKAGRYLHIASGEPTKSVLKLIRQELLDELRNGLYLAMRKGEPASSIPLEVHTTEGTEHIRLQIRPVPGTGDKRGHLLVVFEPAVQDIRQERPTNTSDETLARNLQEELARLRSQLRAVHEQHDHQAEELTVGNEQLLAMNEKLHAATEELETSKEELQSINEELSTVNQELKVKVEEATMVGDNLQNLINSSDIGTIFLDRSFRVVLFTPAARSIFNLIAADHGRPLSDITNRLEQNDLLEQARIVLEQLQVIAYELRTTDGRIFFTRLVPYHTEEDLIRGVVITFFDITQRKKAEEDLRESYLRNTEIMESISDAFYAIDADFNFTYVNKKAEEFWGRKREQLLGKHIWTEFPMAVGSEAYSRHYTALQQQMSVHFEAPSPVIDRWIDVSIYPNAQGGLLCYFRDITERKNAEVALRESEEKFRGLFEAMDEGYCIIQILYGPDGTPEDFRYLLVNPAFEKHNGLHNATGRTIRELAPDIERKWLDIYSRVAETGTAVRFEEHSSSLDGRVFDLYAFRIGVPAERKVAVLFTDITIRRQQEQHQAFLLRLNDALAPLTDSFEIQKTATALLGEQLQADRVCYALLTGNYETAVIEHEYRIDSLPSVIGRHSMAPFARVVSAFRNGRSITLDDVENDPAMPASNLEAFRSFSVRSMIIVPLFRDGRTIASLSVLKTIPYHWSAHELSLVQETADRTWALVERARAEEALRKSEARLRITMDSAVDYAIINTDTEGIIEGWSRGAELTFGWKEAEVLGRNARLIFTPEDQAAHKPEEEMEIAIREGRAPDERWHIREDGQRFFMSGVMRPIYDDNRLRGFVKVARDLTEQRQAEESLRIHEERYRVALQSAGMAAWDWNVTEDKSRWNEQHFLLLGLAPEESTLEGSFFFQFVHPDDAPAVREALREAVEEHGVYRMEAFRIIRADTGAIRWMSGYGRAVLWQDGKAIRLVGVMFDISKSVEATMALRDRQLKLDIAQRAARIGIWGFDLVKNQGIATPEWNELTGYPAPGDTFELDVFLSLIHPEDRAQVLAAHRQAVNGQSTIELEFRLEHPERGLLWLLQRGQYIPPYNGMSATLMGSLIDITERKVLEQLQEQFIGIASHELRTPVTSVKAYVQLLQESISAGGDTESAGLISRLDQQVDRLTELIHVLLDATRITKGQLQLNLEHFVMDGLIRDTVETMQRVHRSHKLLMRLDDGGVYLHADRERIRQVLLNLLSNAVKYSPDADRVVITTQLAGDSITVGITDYGIGIAAVQQAHIFDRFYRVSEPETGHFPGLGLGLFISAEIIHRHNGRIWVESVKDEGATFYFNLPLHVKNDVNQTM